MMESLVSSRPLGEVARRRAGLRSCPHCGGNVRLIRDVYGAYHQCLQCSREIDPAALVAPAHKTHTMTPMNPGIKERMVA